MVVIAGVSASHISVSQTSSQVRLQRLGVGGEEGGQGDRAGLLLALEQHGDVARQAAIGAEGAAGLEEGHQLAFVVAGAAGDDARTARPVGEARLERRGRPQAPAGRPAGRRNGRRTARSARRGSSPWPRRRPSAGRRCRGGPPRSRDRRVPASASRRRARNRRNGLERRRPRGSPASANRRSSASPWLASIVESTSSSVAMRSPARRPGAAAGGDRPCF